MINCIIINNKHFLNKLLYICGVQQPFLNVQQVADKLALSKKTIYRMVEASAIPHYRIREEIRFSTEQLEKWLEKRNFK